MKTTFDKNYLLENLKENVCEVVFTKKDGDKRHMFCTLIDSHIPEESKPKNILKFQNENVLRVFDIEIDEWRSFNVDSVEKFDIVRNE